MIVISRKEFHASFKVQRNTLWRGAEVMCPVWHVCDICDQLIVGRAYFFEFENDGDLPGRNVVVCDDCRATAVEYRGIAKTRPRKAILSR
jgi:hypothetical protein